MDQLLDPTFSRSSELAYYTPSLDSCHFFSIALFLLNPRWVKWFKKCFAQDDKCDQKDPFYIAERTRTRRPEATWSPYLPLRFYTRLRFHLVQNLAREKCYFMTFLFLKASSYRCLEPFSNVFGATSRLVLTQQPTLDELADLPVAELAAHLYELSGHHLPDPLHNAHQLHRVVHLNGSFHLDEALAVPVQRILDLTLAHICFLEAQVQQVDDWIATELQGYPVITQLATIPGVGPVFSSGLGAEIGPIERFLQAPKWDVKRKDYRPRNLRDAEDAVAKTAGLWWPRADSGDFAAEDRRMATHAVPCGKRAIATCGTISSRPPISRSSGQRCPEYTTFYQRKYAESTKHHHKRALVLTARKSVGLIVGLLHRNEAYRSPEA